MMNHPHQADEAWPAAITAPRLVLRMSTEQRVGRPQLEPTIYLPRVLPPAPRDRHAA